MVPRMQADPRALLSSERATALAAQVATDKLLYDPYLSSISAFGPCQFAYTVGRGARDALAILAPTWIIALGTGRKIAVYCSDVSGAFDRVSLQRLVAKLRKKGLHPQLIAVMTPWLQKRFAHVVVSGESSKEMILSNMVFQGTVTGPGTPSLKMHAMRPMSVCMKRSVLQTT